jgi:hypothetical protein
MTLNKSILKPKVPRLLYEAISFKTFDASFRFIVIGPFSDSALFSDYFGNVKLLIKYLKVSLKVVLELNGEISLLL